MTKRITKHGLQIEYSLSEFVEKEVIPGTGIEEDHFWSSFSQIAKDFSPLNQQLLEERLQLQIEINSRNQ